MMKRFYLNLTQNEMTHIEFHIILLKKIQKTWLLPIFILGMLIIFQGCEKEHIDDNFPQNKQPEFKIQTIDYQDLISDKAFIQSSKPYLKDLKSSSFNKDTKDYLLLSLKQIKKITTNQNTTYTFQVINKVFENSTYENLLLKNVNNQLSFILIQYITHDTSFQQFEINHYPVNVSGISIDNEMFNKALSSEFMVVDLNDGIDESAYSNNSGAGGGCAKIYYEACYLPNGGRGGADGHKAVCQHAGNIHKEASCDLMCSGSETIIDLSNCIEAPEEEYIWNNNPLDQNSTDGINGGGGSGGGTSTTTTNYTLTSPTYSDGTSATAVFLINILGDLSPSQLEWIKNPDHSTEVDQLILFISQNGSSTETIDFVKQAVNAQNISLLNEMFDWMNENENSQESIIASTLTLTAINNNILTSGYSPEVANILNQQANVDFIDPTYYIYFTIQCAIINLQHPDWPDYRVYWEASKEMVHLGIDVAGLVPVAGEVCDVLNGVIYTIEGDGVNAGLSYTGAIPVAGWFATGSKFAYKGALKFVVKADGLIDFGVRNSKKFREALGLVAGDGKHAHHIIPWELREVSDLVQKAAKSPNAYHIDDALINGFPLNSTNHLTGHSIYTEKIKQKLINLNASSTTPQQAYANLINFTNQVKQILQNNPNLNLGQIANLIP